MGRRRTGVSALTSKSLVKKSIHHSDVHHGTDERDVTQLGPNVMNRKIPLLYFFFVIAIAAITMPAVIATAKSDFSQYVPRLLVFISAIVVHLGLTSSEMRFPYRWIAIAACPTLLLQGMLGVPSNWPGARMFDITLMLVIATFATGIAHVASGVMQKKSNIRGSRSSTYTENA